MGEQGLPWYVKYFELMSAAELRRELYALCERSETPGFVHDQQVRISALEAELKAAREENERLTTDKMHHALAGEIADLRAAERELKTQLAAERTRREAAERTLALAEDLVGGDDAAEWSMMRLQAPELLPPLEMVDRISLLYRVLHSANPQHSCYGSHADWRVEYDAIANQGKEDA